jgi:hypothetical protein
MAGNIHWQDSLFICSFPFLSCLTPPHQTQIRGQVILAKRDQVKYENILVKGLETRVEDKRERSLKNLGLRLEGCWPRLKSKSLTASRNILPKAAAAASVCSCLEVG